MPFNSLQFAAFFIIVFLLYLVLKHKWQNRLLLVASCVFYAAWDWRFLGLIFISITTDYFCALKIHASDDEKIKKRFLILSILVNLSILGFFKYFNFFSANFVSLLGIFGLKAHPLILKLALPLGISFYTFRTLSYTIDVYTGRIEPTRSYPDYALFVSFFPLLAAGPIMRAPELLPQIASPRKLTLDKFYEGCFLIFWGLFQKIAVADNLATLVNNVFDAPAPYNGVMVLLALYAYAFQIYCDFAGYSNIAMGIGKCLGIEIPLNFNLPYFATNPIDFWRRWHITLSSWLRDYIYTPLVMTMRNLKAAGIGIAVMLTFLICGLWHGAAWQFILWGAYWGLLIILYSLIKPVFQRMSFLKNKTVLNIWFWIKAAAFFQLVCLGWLMFRAESTGQILQMLRSILRDFHYVRHTGIFGLAARIFLFTMLVISIEIAAFVKKDRLVIFRMPAWLICALYVIIYLMIVLSTTPDTRGFMYVRF